MEKGITKIKKIISKKMIIGAGILICAGLIIWGIGSEFKSSSKTTTLGLRNIGELATQSAYVTEVDVLEDARTLFGMSLPGTQSKYIYSYDFVIKAGFQVEDIVPKVDEESKIVNIKMPKAEVLSNEVKLDSMKVYLEDESVFTQITMDKTNQAFIKLQNQAQEDAIANGLLEAAEENAKIVLTGLFSNQFNPDEYTYNFEFE